MNHVAWRGQGTCPVDLEMEVPCVTPHLALPLTLPEMFSDDLHAHVQTEEDTVFPLCFSGLAHEQDNSGSVTVKEDASTAAVSSRIILRMKQNGQCSESFGNPKLLLYNCSYRDLEE